MHLKNHFIIICVMLFLTSSLPYIANANEGREDEKNTYTLVYININDTPNYKKLTEQLKSVFEKVNKPGNDYLFYLTINKEPFKASKAKQFESLLKEYQDIDQTLVYVNYDLENILKYWDKEDLIDLDADGRVIKKYNRYEFIFFTTPRFFNLQFEILVEKLLKVKNLDSFKSDIKIKLYAQKEKLKSANSEKISQELKEKEYNVQHKKY